MHAAPASPAASSAAFTPHHPVLRPLSWASFWLSVLALGLMAGFFTTYSINVNLATRELDGPTYALVQSAFNRNVRHALFFALFFGPMPLCLAALVTDWAPRQRWWQLTAGVMLAYGLGIVVFTREVNLPLNHLTESWTAATLPADWARTRDAWNRANAWRSVLSLALFAASLLALSWRLRAPGATATPQVAP